MGHLEGVGETGPVRLGFDRRVRLEFHGSKNQFGRRPAAVPGTGLGGRATRPCGRCFVRYEERPQSTTHSGRVVASAHLWSVGGIRGCK